MAYERLTDEDLDNLVAAMLDVMAEQPKAPFHLIVMKAQEKALPPNKRYSRSVVQQRHKWSKRVQDALKAAGVWPGYTPEAQEAPQRVTQAAAPIPAPVPTPAPAPLPVVQQPLAVQTQPPQPTLLIAQLYEAIRSDLRSDIIQLMDTRIEEQVRLQLRATLASAEELGSGDQPQLVNLTELIERTEVTVSIPRVFVVGLLPEQALILRRKLHGVPVDLRFWKNEANSKLHAHSAWADHIFIMSNFVSHSHIHAITSKTPREKIKYANGGVSDLERQIRFVLTEEEKA